MASALQPRDRMKPVSAFVSGLVGGFACIVAMASFLFFEGQGRVVRDTSVLPAVVPSVAVSGTDPDRAAILDVATGVPDVTSMIRLEAGEHVVTVDGVHAASDLHAGAMIAATARGTGRYVDLVIGSDSGTRRLVVLMH